MTDAASIINDLGFFIGVVFGFVVGVLTVAFVRGYHKKSPHPEG